LFIAGQAWAATHYVSNSGSATWANSTNISTPCSVTTAFANADDDDVVYFRGGTYNVGAKNFGNTYYGYYSPSNSGSSGHYITFQAYPGETPVFNGTAGGSGDHSYYATIFGVASKSYIIFDGFTFQADSGTKMARMIIYGEDVYPGGAHHITVQNCIFNGGSTVIDSTDNEEGIRVEDADYITIKNNTIYNYVTSANGCWHNTSGTKAYHTRYCVYENNEVYNCCAGLYDKSQGTSNVYRYNYVHNCANGMLIFCDGYSNTSALVYHNLVTYCSEASIDMQDDDGEQVTDNGEIYNNTIYTTSTVHTLMNVAWGDNHHVYNNILYGSATGYGKLRLKYATSTDEVDYNCYYGGSFKNTINYTGYTSLSSWQAVTLDGGLHPDAHGINSNPAFANGSGNLNTIADFAIESGSPCYQTGKSGVSMGADVSLVGVDAEDTTAPTVTSATINTAGTTLTLAMSESVTNNYTTTVPTLSMSGGAVTATCNSCASGTSLTYTLSRTIYSGETGTYSWDVAANGVEDAAGNDLVDISGAAITNDSEQDTTPPSTPSFTGVMTGSIR